MKVSKNLVKSVRDFLVSDMQMFLKIGCGSLHETFHFQSICILQFISSLNLMTVINLLDLLLFISRVVKLTGQVILSIKICFKLKN